MEVVEHLESEKALRASHERLHAQVEEATEVFWIYDAVRQRILYVSTAYESLWGRTCGSLYADARSWLDAIHPEDRSNALPRDDQVGDGDRFEMEYRIVRPDGTVRWVWDRGFLIRNEGGRTSCVAGIAIDVTRSKFRAQTFLDARQKDPAAD